VKTEGVFRHAVELGDPTFGVAPEALDAVEVRAVVGELVGTVVDSQVPGVDDIDLPVVTTLAVGMDDDLKTDTPANYFN
jgi:hypothetical protein